MKYKCISLFLYYVEICFLLYSLLSVDQHLKGCKPFHASHIVFPLTLFKTGIIEETLHFAYLILLSVGSFLSSWQIKFLILLKGNEMVPCIFLMIT